MVQRLRRELGLAGLAKKPRRRRQEVSTGLPTKASRRNYVWTWDFVHDTTVRGGRLRMLNVMDKYTRECLCIHVEQHINARKVRQVMARLMEEHGASEHIRSHNGSEFIERGLREWLAENKIKTRYITPIRFAQKEQEPQSARCQASLRPGIDFLYNLKHTITMPKLTLALA